MEGFVVWIAAILSGLLFDVSNIVFIIENRRNGKHISPVTLIPAIAYVGALIVGRTIGSAVFVTLAAILLLGHLSMMFFWRSLSKWTKDAWDQH